MSKDYLKKLFNNLIKRCKIIIESEGGRLELEHIREIIKEEIERENDKNIEKKIELDEKKKKLQLKLAYIY